MPLFKCKSTCHLFGNNKRISSKLSASSTSVRDGIEGVYSGKTDLGENEADGVHQRIVSKQRWLTKSHEIISSETHNGVHDRLEAMKAKMHPVTVLLVFKKEDSQCNALRSAAKKLGQHCHLAHSPESALEVFHETCPDIVIVDNRYSKYFDGHYICRSIRSTKKFHHVIVVAIVKKSTAEQGEKGISALLDVGYNKFIMETSNIGICTSELLQLEMSEVSVRRDLRASSALLVALDNCRDAIEVTDDKHEIQYANEAFNNMLGYSHGELVGKLIHEVHQNGKAKMSLQEQLNNGLIWEGQVFNKTKHGNLMQLMARVLPISTWGKKNDHYMYIYANDTRDFDKVFEPLKPMGSTRTTTLEFSSQRTSGEKKVAFRKNSMDSRSIGGNRRQSILRKYSLTLEAPITKVINLLTAIQETCPPDVLQALGKVLAELKGVDIYTPLLQGTGRTDDQTTTDLLAALLSSKQPNSRKYSTSSIATTRSSSTNNRSSQHTHSNLPGILESSNIREKVDSWKSWAFDVIELERVSAKRPLHSLGMAIFNQFDVGSTLECSETTLSNWLTVIESNYHSRNPYHNSTHAADVLHATAYFLTKQKMKELLLDPTDIAACLISAAVHDVDHPGRTSAFLCNSNNDLAILYNDLAVLENHHSALAFKLTTSDARVNIFSELDRDKYKAIRESIIDMVLATDMSKHFEHLHKFINIFTKSTTAKENEQQIVDNPNDSLEGSPETTADGLLLIKRMLIKCADVSNPTRPLPLCISWAERIAEEYVSQTEDEIKKDLPVIMPNFNRNNCNIPKTQTSFTDFFIKDLYEVWDAFLDIPELMANIRDNFQYWQAKEVEGNYRISTQLR